MVIEPAQNLPRSAALLLIDLQRAIDDPSWGVRNNPGAEAQVARLLAHWRTSSRPVIHVRHVSRSADSTYRDGQPGVEFKAVALPGAGELIVTKHAPCAFIGTGLEATLRERGIHDLVIAGVITNNSVEATARVAGDLGFRTIVASDATFTFGRTDFRGVFRSADEVHAMSLANLQGEYADVLATDEIIRRSRT